MDVLASLWTRFVGYSISFKQAQRLMKRSIRANPGSYYKREKEERKKEGKKERIYPSVSDMNLEVVKSS